MTSAVTRLVAHDPIATLTANGIVALGAKLAEDQRASNVTARSYKHPAMAGTVIIRLEPDAVAAGTDAEMAAFGFDAPKATKALGQVRSRTLGFPGWALVHDPKKAKAALDVAEDMRKAKRMVASKPGHAKEAFEKIAKQLQKTAPQFLPSFWEEVGRVFADLNTATMGAQCFERARQAERAYKLKIDADDADEVFVEFALLGALSAKTLTAYAKDLTKSAGGTEAYRRFRAIVVKRALGGMPPYSGMGKDLAALAKAAKADLDKEADALAADLVEAPGVGKAPIEFWTTYRESFLRLGKSKLETRNRLRALWPSPRGGTEDTRAAFTETWMALLDEIGAFTDVPDDGLGGWVSRLIMFAGNTPRVQEIIKDVAPRLASTKQPIKVGVTISWGEDLSLDLAELALGLGIELAPPDEYHDFSPDTMTCDPVRVAEHPVYGKKLVEVVSNMIGESEHEHRMRGKAGFATARRRWLEEQLAELEAKPFQAVQSGLTTLDRKTTPEMFLGFPDLHARLAKVDLAASLAAHLRGGLADEFGWPAYEQAVAALGKPMKTGGAFPYLTAWNATKVIAMGPTGVIGEHDLVYKPKKERIENVWFLDGQFLVDVYDHEEYDNWQYWSNKPKDRFEQKASISAYGGDLPNQWSPPGGGVTLGKAVFRAGDRENIDDESFLCDGTQMWTFNNGKYFLFNPVEGKKGKQDTPAFLGEPREGWTTTAVMQPVPAGLASTPLGMKDGVLGLRRRAKDDDWDDKFPTEYERIDGVTWKSTHSVFALANFPDGSVRAIDTAEPTNQALFNGDGPGVDIYSADDMHLCTVNGDDWAARGWDVAVPPATFWDYLTPRDVAGSKALRQVTFDTAAVILAAARKDVDVTDKTPRPMPNAEAAVRTALPQITNDALVRGIAGIAERAAELSKQATELAESRAKDKADPGGAGLLGEAAQIRKLAGLLAAGRETKVNDFDTSVDDYLGNLRARAALALSPVAEAEERRKIREVIQAVTGTIFADDLSKLRWLSLDEPDNFDNQYDDTLYIRRQDGSIFAIHESNNWAVELSTDGAWRVPAGGWKISEEKKFGKAIGTQWADAYLELPDEALPWDPAIAQKIAERGDLSPAEAMLLWVNVKGMSTYSRDFLGKKNRELLGGIKVNEADAAKTTFEEIEDDKMMELYERAVPDNPALLRTPLAAGGFAERIGDAWKAKYGKRAKIPQDLIAAAKKELDLSDDLSKLLATFTGGLEDAKFMRPDLRPLKDLGGYGDDDGLTSDLAGKLVTLVSWLFLSRPIGDAVRAGIPAVVDKLSEIVDEPKLVWPLESNYVDNDDKDDVKRQQGTLEAVGGSPIEQPKDGDDACLGARDDGTCIVAAYVNNTYAGFRPAKLDNKTRKKVAQVANLLQEEDEYTKPMAPVEIIEVLKSAEFRAFGERAGDTPVPEGSFEANPLVSAPKLVAKVTKAHGISDDAAALYLITLALAEPTQQRVQLWMGWKPKQYKEAAAELAKKKLVTEGKRERAGRTVFVKGGYSKGSGKNLPMEDWKQAFYRVIERHLPLEPCHLLFARAYKRIEDGDKP